MAEVERLLHDHEQVEEKRIRLIEEKVAQYARQEEEQKERGHRERMKYLLEYKRRSAKAIENIDPILALKSARTKEKRNKIIYEDLPQQAVLQGRSRESVEMEKRVRQHKK
ncbi:unnamed protein product, partial [Amoebophrya sp. A120]|eukprot:GSA120T00025993001.1